MPSRRPKGKAHRRKPVHRKPAAKPSGDANAGLESDAALLAELHEEIRREQKLRRLLVPVRTLGARRPSRKSKSSSRK